MDGVVIVIEEVEVGVDMIEEMQGIEIARGIEGIGIETTYAGSSLWYSYLLHHY